MYAALVVAAMQRTVLSQCFQWVNNQGCSMVGQDLHVQQGYVMKALYCYCIYVHG